jgi:soluble lytic murein transglycosylase
MVQTARRFTCRENSSALKRGMRWVLPASGTLWALLLMLVCSAASLSVPNVSAAADEYEQRRLYRQGIAKLRAGQSITSVKKQLANYLLAPYLDYHYLNARISAADTQQVIAFINDHSSIPASNLLKSRWLRVLGRNRQWQMLLQHYTDGRGAELNCYYLRALYGTGEKEEALARTADAWIKQDSQPKSCDPLFDVWQASSHFNEAIVWRRLSLALQHNEVTLARYLLRFFSQKRTEAERDAKLPSAHATAEAFYQAHVSPNRISQTNQYLHRSSRYKTIIAHGLSRLTRRSPERAAKAWAAYQSWDFWSKAERAELALEVAIGLAGTGVFPPHAQRDTFSNRARFIEFADLAIKTQNWSEIIDWVDRLDLPTRNEAKWQYWLARALEATVSDSERARLTYRALAEQRHYYGFLAAQRLGLPGQMNAQNGTNNPLTINKLRNNPALERSLELRAVGDDINARREWFAELNRLAPQEQILAAELARENGLLTLAILTANEANARDHLHLRFPIGFEPQFRQAALTTGLPAATLVAVARQESAMNHSAKSHADAHGLMQLLPSTAKLVARRHGLSYSNSLSLFDPGTNISLGSSHLAWLINRYQGQTPLAFAAYNAGEHRVDRWIKQAAGLPMDIWIEQIPFRETRNYVKNVLAFRHVYAERLGMSLPMLAPVETQVAIP